MAANWETYDQGALAEDVEDEIYIISPVDNPIASMSKTIRATGTTHQWHEDKLKAAGSNRAAEGADAPDQTPDAVLNRFNYTQIMTKTVNISGTIEEVNEIGLLRAA